MLPEERLSTAANRSRVCAGASWRCDLKCHSVASVSEVFAQRAFHSKC